ncbi:MAG: NACHT domain-containing protein [Chloroflexi bacterium]|nr:NACHT domain-containing protein [Chloroflexota bacterium]
MVKQYNLTNIRAFLTEGFTAGELRDLCFEVLDFRSVYDQLAESTGKADIVRRLLEYAERQGLLETLLDQTKKRNPAKYEKYLPYELPGPEIDDSIQDLKSFLTEVCKQVAKLLRVQNASIWLLEEKHKLTIKAGIGYFENLLEENASYDLGEGITGSVASSGKVFRGTMEDVRGHDSYKGEFLDSSFKTETEEPATLLMMPIYSERRKGGIIGIIKVEGTRQEKQDIFDEHDEETSSNFIRDKVADIEAKLPPGYIVIFPPPISLLRKPGVEHNLQERKVILTFEGRKKEIKDCSKLLKGPFPLVTISGDAGVGKTTLATKIAWGFINPAKKFGAVFDDLFSKLASALKIEYKLNLSSEDKLFEQKKELLRKKLEARKTLLILDNFEGLIDNKFCIDLLKALLSIDSLHILVTSRPTLSLIPWEKVYKLPPLERNEAENLFVKHLFLKLGKRELSDKDKSIIREICELVHHIPLGIELVSQHTEMGLEQLRDRLKENRLLYQKVDGFLDMELSLLFSYDRLKDHEKRLFLELCIFNGSFALKAVNAITGQENSYSSLQKLYEWKLVRQSGVRYYLLETIKQFSKSKLDREGMKMQSDKDDISEKHANYYLEFLEKNHQNLSEIKTEYENIIEGLQWITEKAKTEPPARKLLISSCFYLQEYWRIRGEWKAAREYTEKAIEAARTENDLLSEAKLLFIICQTGTDLGIFQETHPTFKEALTLVDKLLEQSPKDREVLRIKASLLHQYGRLIDNCVYKLQKIPVLKEYLDVPPPEKYFGESLRIWENLQDERQKARILQALGFRAMVNDDLRKAISLQRESVNVTRKINYRELEGRCLHQMGRIALKLHNLVRKDFYMSPEEITEIREQLDEEVEEASSKNDLQRAAILLNYACDIAVEIGDQRAESRTRREIGLLKITLAEETESSESRKSLLDEAEKELNKALEIAQKINERTGEEKIHEELKRLEKAKGIQDAS